MANPLAWTEDLHREFVDRYTKRRSHALETVARALVEESLHPRLRWLADYPAILTRLRRLHLWKPPTMHIEAGTFRHIEDYQARAQG